MPLLLAIDRDDAFLPKGWVTAILSEGAEPSEYEKSAASPWQIVEIPVAQTLLSASTQKKAPRTPPEGKSHAGASLSGLPPRRRRRQC